MEPPEDLLPCSQEPITSPCPEAVESSPQFGAVFPNIHSNIFPCIPRSSELSLPFRFSNQNFVCIIMSSMCATNIRGERTAEMLLKVLNKEITSNCFVLLDIWLHNLSWHYLYCIHTQKCSTILFCRIL